MPTLTQEKTFQNEILAALTAQGWLIGRFLFLLELVQGLPSSTPCGSHMLAQGRAASAETLGLRFLQFFDPSRVAQRWCWTLCDPRGVGNILAGLTQGRSDPGLACATRKGSSGKPGACLSTESPFSSARHLPSTLPEQHP